MSSSGGSSAATKRTYNSQSTHPGWFGVGWGSMFETRVRVQANGHATVRENGVTSPTIYLPALDPVVQSLKSKPMRMVWRAAACLQGRLERTNDGYTRIACDQSIDAFAADGRLLSREKVGGDVFTAQWTDDQRVTSITDQQGNALQFDWSDQGRVRSVKASNDARVTYTYNSLGQLVDFNGPSNDPTHRYTYNSAGRMAGLHFFDGTSRRISYTPSGRVNVLTGRRGENETYTYAPVPGYPNVMETRVVRSDRDGPTDIPSVYRWNIALNKLVSMQEGGQLRQFQYDQKGQLLNVKSRTEGQALLNYDRRGRIIRAKVGGPGESLDTMQFAYDKGQRLIRVRLNGKGEFMIRYLADVELDTATMLGDPLLAMHVTTAIERLRTLVQSSGDPLPW